MNVISNIDVKVFDDWAKFVAEGESYWPEDYRFRSHANYLVCEPSDLWISYRDD